MADEVLWNGDVRDPKYGGQLLSWPERRRVAPPLRNRPHRESDIERVRLYLSDGRPRTMAEIGGAMGWSATKANSPIHTLKRRGQIKVVGARPVGQTWRATVLLYQIVGGS